MFTPPKLRRQISGDMDGSGQAIHDQAQDGMEHFLLQIGLSPKTADRVASFIASKHSYNNQDILAAFQRSPKEIIKGIHDFVDSHAAVSGYYGPALSKQMRSELFEFVKTIMLEPTPKVSAAFLPTSRQKIPTTQGLADGLAAYLADKSSTYTMPQNNDANPNP
jgi:hypothetical protein